MIHEVYTLFQDRRGETEPEGRLGKEKTVTHALCTSTSATGLFTRMTT